MHEHGCIVKGWVDHALITAIYSPLEHLLPLVKWHKGQMASRTRISPLTADRQQHVGERHQQQQQEPAGHVKHARGEGGRCMSSWQSSSCFMCVGTSAPVAARLCVNAISPLHPRMCSYLGQATQALQSQCTGTAHCTCRHHNLLALRRPEFKDAHGAFDPRQLALA